MIVLVDGQISEVGSYEELLSHDGAFAHFLNTYFTEEVKDEDEQVDLDNDPEGIDIHSHIFLSSSVKSKTIYKNRRCGMIVHETATH